MRTGRRLAAGLASLMLALTALTGCAPPNRYSEAGDQIPRTDLEQLSATPFEDAEVVGGSQVRITFYNGLDACYGHDVEVEETAGTITISVSTGWIPGDRACTFPAVLTTTLVETTDPVGDREIIDGNAE